VSRHTADADSGDVDRKRLVRLMILIGIVLIVVIEGVTFAGLLGDALLGGNGDGNGGAGTATDTATPATDRVGVGDELLAETPQRETVRAASVTARDDGWVFQLTLAINNTADSDYQFRFETVETTGGQQVDGSGSIVVPAGESDTVTGRWVLPESERPDAVTVVGVQLANETTVTETVAIERIPVQYQ
jgi:hypothetical protein